MRNFAIPPLVTLQPSPAEQNGSFRSTSSAYWSSPLYYSSLHERFTKRGGGVYTHGSDRVAWVRTQSVGVRYLWGFSKKHLQKGLYSRFHSDWVSSVCSKKRNHLEITKIVQIRTDWVCLHFTLTLFLTSSVR